MNDWKRGKNRDWDTIKDTIIYAINDAIGDAAKNAIKNTTKDTIVYVIRSAATEIVIKDALKTQ